MVAGGASGIGAATSQRLAQEGANVVVGDVNAGGAADVASRITDAGGRAIAFEFDLATDESCSALMDAALERFDGLTGLFNVGADLSDQTLGRDGDLLELPVDVWHRTLDVNLTGYFRTMRAALPHMLEREGGSIVNTSSGVVNGFPRFAAYGASKAGVVALTKHVATAFGKRGVRCNVIDPGLTLTENQLERVSEEERASMLPQFSATRFSEPRDIAGMVAFLLSDDASVINGQAYSVSSSGGGIG